MEKFEMVIPDVYQKKRLDAYLAEVLTGKYSRQEIKSCIVRGFISVNGKPGLPKTMVGKGDVISGELDAERESTAKGEAIPLKVVFEDNYLIVIDKAAGMVVHPGAGNPTGTLVNALLGRGGELSSVGGVGRPGIVHRLDKATSGLLVVAKTNGAHRKLQSQFESRTVTKIYLALVRGRVEFEQGHVNAAITRHPAMRDRMSVSDSEKAKEAESSYKVRKRFGTKATLVEVRIHTGRTHQIRVHMAHLGYPLIGDRVYGRQNDEARRLALHAAHLEFDHPATGERLSFDSEPPQDFLDVVESFEGGGGTS